MLIYNDFSGDLNSIIEEITQYKSKNKLAFNYTETELLGIIHRAFEQNEMAIYLINELYKSILLSRT